MECFTAGIARLAQTAPDAPALVTIDKGVASYRLLVETLAGIAEALAEHGLERLRIATFLDGLPAALMQLAVPQIGVCVPLNPKLPFPDALRAVERAGAGAVVLGTSQDDLAEGFAGLGFPVLRFSVGHLDPADIHLRSVSPGRQPGRARDEGHIAYLLQSSGTTGDPKLIPIDHDYLRVCAKDMSEMFALGADDRAACTAPVYYCAGLTHTLMTPLLGGGSVAFPPENALRRVTEWIEDLKPTWLTTSPTSLRSLLDNLPPGRGGRLGGVRFIVAGGSMVPDTLAAEVEERVGAPLQIIYGMTEAGVIAGPPPPPMQRRPGAVGLPIPGRLMVRTLDGAAARVGELGMVCLRGPNLMPGYLDQEPLNGAWLETGDLGYLHEDGQLTLAGRAKEMINRGGEKVSPYEIEAVALEHPEVGEAAAFGVEHPRLGEIPALAVVLKDPKSADPDDIRTFLAGRLATFKVPRRIILVEAMPTGPTGKVQRARLAEFALQQERAVTPPVHPLEYQIVSVWRRLLERQDVGVDDDFFDLGGDSLLAINMLLEIEEITGRKTPDAAIGAAVTIRGISEAFAEQPGGDWRQITEATTGDGRPFYFCHGDYSTRGFYAHQLAKEMGLQRPVRLVHPAFEQRPQASFQEMAAACVDEILQRQPSGDLDIGGFCNGGLLAWEIAHQLERKGRRVGTLVLIDVLSLNARSSYRLAAPLVKACGGRPRWMTTLWNLALLNRTPAEILARIRAALPWNASAPEPRPAHDPDRLKRPVLGVMSSYFPPPLAANLHCLLSEEGRLRQSFSPEPWRRLVAQVQASAISGDHHECVTTFGPETARVLNSILTVPPDEQRAPAQSEKQPLVPAR